MAEDREEDGRIADYRSMLSLVLHDLGKIREAVGRMTGEIQGLREQTAGLETRFDAVASEFREGQGKQDDRLTQLATAQARHSTVIGIGATLVGIISGIFGRNFIGAGH